MRICLAPTHVTDQGLPIQKQSASWLLHKVVKVGQRGLVQLLIQGGAIVSSIIGGETVLHCAAGEGHNEVVKILLARGPSSIQEMRMARHPCQGPRRTDLRIQ